MTTIDISNLGIEDLNALKLTVDSAIVSKRQSELSVLRQRVDDLIDSCPFTLQEIMEAKAIRKPVLPKYQNPHKTDQTWTGRGRRPRWVEDCLINGMDLTDLLI